MASTDDRTAAEQAARHDPVYDGMQKSDDFVELRRRYRRFAFPATAAFLVWYLLYVLMCSYTPGFMSIKLVGNINVGLVFGLLQFVTTFLIAYLYSKYSIKHLDPLAERLRADYDKGRRQS